MIGVVSDWYLIILVCCLIFIGKFLDKSEFLVWKKTEILLIEKKVMKDTENIVNID